jgi:hypothetical protein
VDHQTDTLCGVEDCTKHIFVVIDHDEIEANVVNPDHIVGVEVFDEGSKPTDVCDELRLVFQLSFLFVFLLLGLEAKLSFSGRKRKRKA